MESATLPRTPPARILSTGLPPALLGRLRRLALAVLVVVAVGSYLAFPTYPTYDSFYALLWGKQLLAGHLPNLHVYRAPTEHPLALAFGAFCSIFGSLGPRLMVLGSCCSLLALIVGCYRVGRAAFGELVGWLTAALMVTRFYTVNLAIQGYLDISYLALVVWALALELERPRRGRSVAWLLACAGLLRPDAWVLGGLYWLWWAVPASRQEGRCNLRFLVRSLLPVLAAPLLWICADTVLTGDPIHSLKATSELATALERSAGLHGALASLYPFAVRIDKEPVVIGALIGAALALYLLPRRAAFLVAATTAQVAVFVAEGAAGASVIDRYLLGAATFALPLAAFTLGGWALLRPSLWQAVWAAGAVLLVCYGALNAVANFHIAELPRTMAYHEDFGRELAKALHQPAVAQALRRCPLLSLPDNKLMPYASFVVGEGKVRVVARSEATDLAEEGRPALDRRLAGRSVAVYPLGAAVFYEALVDPGDRAIDQVPPAHFRRLYASRFYAVYANC